MDRPDVQQIWHKFNHHEFVEGLGKGTLPVQRFKEYLVQDYLYLVSADFGVYFTLETLLIRSCRSNSLAVMHLHHTRPRAWTQ